jgi:WD40 repeat protein
MYTLSAHSAELTKQEVSTTINAEGKHFLCKDVYDKLLAVSGTLQNHKAELGTPNPANLPEVQDPYYEIGHDTQYLQYIIDYISTDNTHAYLDTLSLVQLIHLYQNADYWALGTPILDNLRTHIAEKLQNKDVLNDIFSTRKSLGTFLNACNFQTKTTLAQVLLPHVRNLFWSLVTKPHQTLTGHTSCVSSVAVHTNGTLFSGSGSKIRVWKPDAQGTYHCVQTLCMQTLNDHTHWIDTLAVHPDGTLFSSSIDGRVWKTDAQATYHCTQTLTHPIRAVAVHPDGTLFSGSGNKIRVWKKDARDAYHCVQTLTGHTSYVSSVAVHSDGTLLSGSFDGTIRVWKKDAQDIYQCVQTLTGHTDAVFSVAVHTDGTLFSGSRDTTIRVWKPGAQDTYHCIQALTNHTNSIKTVAVHTDGTLFSGCDDGTTRVWKKDAWDTYHHLQTLIGHIGYSISSVAVHTDGTSFSGSNDARISVWKVPVLQPLSLEQCLTVLCVYHHYHDNNEQQLSHVSRQVHNFYNTLPISVKNIIIPWYHPTPIPLYKKLLVTGIAASIIGAGCYLYYKWFRK